MKKLLFSTILVLLGVFAYAQPTISSFTPSSGLVGSIITITGSNFSTTSSANVVFFGATKAVVNSATSTSLTVTVPVGAICQYISVTNMLTGLTAYSSKPFIPAATCGSGNIDMNSFSVENTLSTGLEPQSITVGDLDGDGKSDIAVANHGLSTISLYRNTSTTSIINFTPLTDIATGTRPVCLKLADIDGDGRLDIIVVNYKAYSISIFRNISTIGNIAFDIQSVDFSETRAYPTSLSVSDLDSDGKPDLILTGFSYGTLDEIYVFKNISLVGSISFNPFVTFATTVSSSPKSSSIGDLDGDGKPDVLLVNSGSSTFSVLRNTSTGGTISFGPIASFTTGTSPSFSNIVDIDGDGKSDVVVVNGGENTISVLKNNGSVGAISFSPKVDFTTGALPYGLSVGDIDGDSKPDVAVTNSGGTISILKNNSSTATVSFAPYVSYVVGQNPEEIFIADLNSDGKPDIATGNYGDNTLSIYRNVSTGTAPTISGLFSVCSGSTTTLTGSGTADVTTPWSSAITGVATISKGGVATGIAAGNTTIKYKNSFGCSSTANLTVNATPTIIGVTNATRCGTGPVTLSATSSDGLINWYSNNVGGVSLGAVINFPIANLTSTSNYYVDATSANGCTTASRTLVTASVTPAPNAGTLGGIQTICQNGNTTFTTNGDAGGIWSSGNTNFATISSTSGLISPVSPGTSTISYTVLGTGNCAGTNATVTRLLTINPNNFVSSPSSNPTVCINTSMTPITQSTTGATGIGTANGLPTGVTASWIGNTITISGTPTASGTFYYSIPLVGGCGTVNASGTIVVTPVNTVGVASSSPTLCINTPMISITHSTTGVTGIGTATNLPAGVTASLVGNTLTISGTPTASGTFSYSIPLIGGCGNVNATGLIVVTPAKTVGLASSSPTLCVNTSMTNITHSISGVTSIGTASNLPAGVTASWATNTLTISGTPTTSGTFNYSIPLLGGCGNANATGSIVVNALPTVIASASIPTICTGNNTVVSASGISGTSLYTWNPVAGTVSPSTQTTYTVTGTDGNGCSNIASVIIYVNSKPTITASSNNSAICIGNKTVVSATGGTGLYTWNPIAGTVSPTITTTYTVTGTDDKGCMNTASVTVFVNALPTVIAKASLPTICNGSSTVVSAQGAISYIWNSQVGTVSPSQTTLYSVTGTDKNGCVNTSSVTVQVITPALPIVKDTTISLGDNVPVLTAQGSYITWYDEARTTSLGTGSNYTPEITTDKQAYFNYKVTNTVNSCESAPVPVYIRISSCQVEAPKVSPSTQTICSDKNFIAYSATGSSIKWYADDQSTVLLGTGMTYKPTTAGTIYVSQTTTCESAKQKLISTINPLPTVIADAKPTICSGSSTTVSASGASSYVWSPAAGIVFPTTKTVYTVSGTDQNGCINTTSVTVNVNSRPTIAAIAKNPIICVGTATEVSAISDGSLLWNPAAGTVSPSLTTLYTVTATGSNGCTSTATVNVVVNNVPTVIASATFPTICAGTTTTLSAQGASSYLWNVPTSTVSPSLTSVYSVTGTNDNGCKNTASVTLTVNAKPTIVASATFPTICNGFSTVVSATGANNLQWNPIAGTVSPSLTTVYTVTGTGDNSCTNTANIKVVVNQPSKGDTTASAIGSFKWYGTTYTESATPTHTFKNKAVCDSVVTLHVTVNKAQILVNQVIVPKTKGMLVGEKATLSVEVLPSTASDKSIIYQSIDTTIVSIDALGHLTAKAEGITYVSATSRSSSVNAFCAITVTKASVPLLSFTVPANVSMVVGQMVPVTVKFTPNNASNQTLTWSSNDPNIAIVSNMGVINALSQGTTTLVANNIASRLNQYIEVVIMPSYPPVVDGKAIPTINISTDQPSIMVNIAPFAKDDNTPDSLLKWSFISKKATISQVNDTMIRITPKPPVSSFKDTITFTVKDKDNQYVAGSLYFNVIQAVNKAPIVTSTDTLKIKSTNGVLFASLIPFATDDYTLPTELFWSIKTPAKHAVVDLTGNNISIKSPLNSWSGLDSIYLRVMDAGNLYADKKLFIKIVSSQNQPPKIATIPVQKQTSSATFGSINLNNFVSDDYTIPTNITWVISQSSKLSFAIENGIVTPKIIDLNWTGYEDITFTAFDEDGAKSSINVVYIQSVPVGSNWLTKPNVNFTTQTSVTGIGQQVEYRASLLGADTWGWILDGASPSTTSVLNPSCVYNIPGTYSVKLIAQNTNGKDSLIKKDFITVFGFVNSDSTVCKGSIVKIKVNVTTLDSYSLNKKQTTSDLVTITSDTLFTVVAQNGLFTYTDTVRYKVNKPVNLGADASICSGATLVLNPGSFASYSWSGVVAGSTPTVSATQTGDYTVSVIDGLKCMSSDTKHVTINALPTLNIGADASICFNTKDSLDAGIASKYLWSTGDKTRKIAFKAIQTSTYSVTITDVNTCQNSDSIKLTVLKPYKEQIGVVTFDTLKGKKVIISWNRHDNQRTDRYILYRDNGKNGWDSIAGLPFNKPALVVDSIADLDLKAYRYKLVTIDQTCHNQDSSIHRTMHVSPLKRGDDALDIQWNTYIGYPSIYYTVMRYNPDGTSLKIADQSGDAEMLTVTDFKPIAGAKYRVIYNIPEKVFPDKLKSDSGPFSQSLSNMAESKFVEAEITEAGTITVHPNPATLATTVELPQLGNYTIKVITVLGNQVLHMDVENSNSAQVSLSQLTAGIYFIIVDGETGVSTIRLIKE